MQKEPDTNSPLANFDQAIPVFKAICKSYPESEQAALAWGEIGDCYLQLTNYDAATGAYAQVTNSPVASVAARSQAQVGIGLVFEKRAAQATGQDQTELLQRALDNYLDVLYEKNLRHGEQVTEQADSFWTEEAGLRAASVTETLGEWQQATNVYGRLEKLLPPLHGSLEKKIANAQEHLAPEKN